MSALSKVEVENFTAFKKLSVDLSPGVKKLLYASCSTTEGEEEPFAAKLRDVFKPYQRRLCRLVRRQQGSATAKLSIWRGAGLRVNASFSNHTDKAEGVKSSGETKWKDTETVAAYIPVKEMLAFLKNSELEFSLLAEGMRKLALIWLLIQNDVLLGDFAVSCGGCS